jgi:hypothetical protein
MVSEARPWVLLGLGLMALVAAVWVFDRVFPALMNRWRPVGGEEDDSSRSKARRRSVSGAAFALQQVFDPGIEHVIRAEQDAQAEEDDAGDPGDDPAATIDTLLADLAACLGRTPIEPEEIRTLLAEALRQGQDWQALYDEAVRLALDGRPYLAPMIPPAARVAPRSADDE